MSKERSLDTADFLIVGGGIAGVSAAAALAKHGRTLLLESETVFGYHSSGRSATYYHFGIGKSVVRGLTAFSRSYFEGPTAAGVKLSRKSPALFVATDAMMPTLDELEREMGDFSNELERLDASELQRMVPVLECGSDGIVGGVIDRSARRLDSEALQQDYRATIKKRGSDAIADVRVVRIARSGSAWVVETARGERFAAPVLINAAGAWADDVARMAQVEPLRLQAMRRTIIAFDAPSHLETRTWPFVKTAVDDFYMLPESGRLLASPVDEVPSGPVDAQPDEYDIALAASKVEQYTSMSVGRINHSWAGLRTFAQDRVPVAGFAPGKDDFFWLAGQGGYGLQTAPAMSAVVESLAAGASWPAELTELEITPEALAPERLERS